MPPLPTLLALASVSRVNLAEGALLLAAAVTESQPSIPLAEGWYARLPAQQNSGCAQNAVALGNYSPEFMLHRIGT